MRFNEKKISKIEWVITILGILIVLLGCMCACSACKTIHTAEQTAYTANTQTAVQHDTTYCYIHDTIYIEVQQSIRTDQGTTIEFAEGGGSYNTKTGEAQNVQSVHEQRQTDEQTQVKAEWQHTEAGYKATIDSLNTTITELRTANETHQQPKQCNHLRIFLWGIAVGIALVYLARLAWWLIKKYYLHK